MLRRFGLKYDRWLRPSEQFKLIPVFEAIIQSRKHSNCFLESFSLSIRSDKKGPIELIEGSEMNIRGFGRLRRIVEASGRLSMTPMTRGYYGDDSDDWGDDDWSDDDWSFDQLMRRTTWQLNR